MRKRQKLVELIVGQLEHLQRLVLIEAHAAFEYLLACLNQNVAHRIASISLLNTVQVRVTACSCTNVT